MRVTYRFTRVAQRVSPIDYTGSICEDIKIFTGMCCMQLLLWIEHVLNKDIYFVGRMEI